MPLSRKGRWCKAPCELQPCRRSSPQRCEFEPAKHCKCCRGCLHVFPGLQRLSLSGNRLSVLPEKVFTPLESLQLLDLGRLGLQQVESDTFLGLSNLRILSLSENRLKVLPEDLLRPMPALEQLLLGGKSDEKGNRIVDGNELSVLSQELLQHSPQLQVLDLSEKPIDLTAKLHL